MVLFQPLGNAVARTFQFLVTLDVNNATILVDCGWDETLSKDTLSELIDSIPKIDLILLTHGTVSHSGAFCYLRYKFPQFRAIPTYATLPVIRMSQLMSLELYQSAGLCGPFDNEDTMSIEDVDAIWSEVNSVKYSQPLKLQDNPKLEGIVITAYNGGHSLGGSMWKIYDGIDSVVVALDWNHARDAHLNGAFLEMKTGTVISDLQKPSVLITSSHVSSGQSLTKARQKFLSDIDAAIKLGGTVLVPTSSGSRILELILVLKKHMSEKQKDIPLIYCNMFGKQALNQASSMLEWMVPSIIGDWQVRNESPFDTNRVSYASDVSELRRKWPLGPKVILASGECLESGPSKQLFWDVVAGDSSSSVIINELCPPNSLGDELLKRTSSDSLSSLNTKFAKIEYSVCEPLTGNKLAEYLGRKRAEQERAELAAAQEKKNQQLIDTSAQSEDDLSESDDDEEDSSHVGTGSSILLQPGELYDFVCPSGEMLSLSDPANYMFPFSAKRRKADDYGEYIPAAVLSDKGREPHDNPLQTESKPEAASDGREVEAVIPIEEKSEELQKSKRIREQKNIAPMTLKKSTRRNVNVVCNIAYADMNGITNLRSLLMVVKQIQPSKTIVIPGNEDVCEHLKKQCQSLELGNKDINFARTNFSVDVRLDPSIRLEWHKLIGGYSVARVSGLLEFDPHDRHRKSGAVLVSSNSKSGNQTETSASSRPIKIGDLRLTALRTHLIEAGLKAEFRDQGILVCNDRVIVRKIDSSTYTLEGGVEEDYYAVRAAIRHFIATL